MGQPVLSYLVNQYHMRVILLLCKPAIAKGNQVNIPELAMEIGASASSAVTQSSTETSAEVLGRVIFSL